MSIVSKEKEAFYLSNVRQLMAIDPGMSVLEIQRQLEDNGISLHRDYLTKLVKKNLTARTKNIDRQTQNQALAHVEGVVTEIVRRMWPIVLSKNSTNKEKIAAANEIREANLGIFKLYQSVGAFDKKFIMAEIEHSNEIDPSIDALVAEIRSLWATPAELAEQKKIKIGLIDNAQ